VSAESIEREIEAMRVPKTAAESVAIAYRRWIGHRLLELAAYPEEFDAFVHELGVGRSGPPATANNGASAKVVFPTRALFGAPWTIGDLVE
jgi:hypothetical protein